MTRLDAWLGLRLFQPPIILFCQHTGMNQFAVYRYIWWIVALWCVYRANFENWAISSIAILLAAGRTLSVGFSPSRPSQPSAWLRKMFLCLAPFDLLILWISGDQVNIIQTISILFAEYALTISTIPPRSTKAKALPRGVTA